MKFRFFSYLLFAFFIANISTYALDNPYAKNSSLYQIEDDYLTGKISLDDKVVLQLNSIKSPNKNPLKYHSLNTVQSEEELREATIALLNIQRIWHELDENTKSYYHLSLARSATAFTYISPSGFFKLHYDTTGVNAVSAVDLNTNMIPDFVERCASYCDSSLDKQLSLGFVAPPNDGGLGGDTLYDVYFENIAYYGYAVPEGTGPNPWNDYYSYLVLNNDFIGFPANSDPEGNEAGAAKATCAHEFHHSIQFGYDAGEDIWAMESGATFIEEAVFDHVNDNYNYLDDFMNFPHTSLMDNSGLHKYGAFLWPLYLAQKFDTTIHVSAWEAAKTGTLFDGYKDTLLANYGWEMDSAYTDFTYWMFNTGTKNDGNHFSEASDYFPVTISNSYLTYPVTTTNSMVNVGGYGATYITFFPGSENGKLKIVFDGSNTRDWRPYIIKSSTINSHEIEYITIDTVSKKGSILIPDFETYYSVTLVGVNIDEYSSSVLFTYSASVIPDYKVSSVIQNPVDPFIYSGSTRAIDILIRNDADLNDVFNVIYWDSLGWVPIDTIQKAILPGDSTIVTIDVTPPPGTPLSTFSTISVKSESWGDPTIFDVQTKVLQTTLYRGDVNFSGEIDISDLVYFVDYMFTSGPNPLPIIQSADFDCSASVDISDLVSFVEYLFSGGPPSLCNPY